MDTVLLRTFIEVAATGSFIAASERLFVTQSAVSLRVQRLEEELSQKLFLRSKAGAELTPAGQEFEKYALGHLKLWEEAKQQIAIPDGFNKSIVIGAEHSLWPRMAFRWVDEIRQSMPTLSIRAELGLSDRLTRFLIEGVVQTTLVYTPQLRPGLCVEKVMEDELVMVSSKPLDSIKEIEDRYIFVDWGPEFIQAHSIHLPQLSGSGLTFALGSLAIDYTLLRDHAIYAPARSVSEHLASGKLHLVPDMPCFPYPIYHVWREDTDEEVSAVIRNALQRAVRRIENHQEDVMNQLIDISEEEEVTILGDATIAEREES